MAEFARERLDVYRVAVEFLVVADKARFCEWPDAQEQNLPRLLRLQEPGRGTGAGTGTGRDRRGDE